MSHIFSNLAMITAAVHSILGGETPWGSSCDNDGIGGAFATLSPQPVPEFDFFYEPFVREDRELTDDKVDVSSRETGRDKNASNLLRVTFSVAKRSVNVVGPLESHVLTPDAQDGILTTCFRDGETEEILNQDKSGCGDTGEGDAEEEGELESAERRKPDVGSATSA